MNEDTDVYLEIADDEHPDAEAAVEDTARLLIEVLARRETEQTESNGEERSGTNRVD